MSKAIVTTEDKVKPVDFEERVFHIGYFWRNSQLYELENVIFFSSRFLNI